MENQSENAAKAENDHFGCRWCGSFDVDGRTWLSTSRFERFIDLMDHLIYHHNEDVRRWEEAGRKQDESPYEPHVFWKTLNELQNRTGPIKSAKQFLPYVADWLQPALASIPDLDNTTSGDMLLAEKLTEQVKHLPDAYREQREYLLAHVQHLRDAAMDPKWLRTPGTQSRFVAESLAGARWGYKTTSREFIRKEKGRTRSAIANRQELTRWWEV